jgi:hypothetical protein
MHKFLNVFYYQFTSALHVSGFLLAYLQRKAYNFGSGSSLLCMVSAPGRRQGSDTIPSRDEPLPKLYALL